MPPLVRYSSRCISQLKKLHPRIKNQPLTSSFTTASNLKADNQSQLGRPRSTPPIQLGYTESAGRGVFATRKIEAGELIHTAKPIVSHPSLSSLHSVCYLCLRKLPKKIPSQTDDDGDDDDVSFCSEECRKQSQGFHNVEKKANWSTFDEHCYMQGLKYPLLVKRFACLVISGVALADSLDILQPATLSSEMIFLMENEFYLLRSSFQDADITAKQLAFLTKEWYTGVLARIRINSFRVELAAASYEDLVSSAAASVNAEAAVGTAMYMLPSFYNHDCDPNTHIIWMENADTRVKALREIEPGEEMRICYIDASKAYKARQDLLFKGFGFMCNCLRCSSHD